MKTEMKLNNQNKQVIEKYKALLETKRRSEGTIRNDIFVLTKLDNFLGGKDFKDATAEEMQAFFKTIKSYSTYNIYGSIVSSFLAWNLGLKKRVRPDCMEWFEYIGDAKMEKESDPDGVKKFFINPEEYQMIVNGYRDQFGLYEALWETFYLSGGRLGEIQNMKIKDVRIEGTNVSVVLYESKTKPRVVPLCTVPHALLRWLGNHPNRDNKEAPLWCHMYNRNKVNEPLSKGGMENLFWTIRNKTDIKKSLSIHCFRKTRATIMFNERSKDGGLIYSDTHMAKYFGWTLQTVAERKKQYDLTTQQDLQDLVFSRNGQAIVQTYDVIKQEKEALENDYKKKLEAMEKQMKAMSDMIMKITDFDKEKAEMHDAYQQAQAEFEDSVNKEFPPDSQ